MSKSVKTIELPVPHFLSVCTLINHPMRASVMDDETCTKIIDAFSHDISYKKISGPNKALFKPSINNSWYLNSAYNIVFFPLATRKKIINAINIVADSCGFFINTLESISNEPNRPLLTTLDTKFANALRLKHMFETIVLQPTYQQQQRVIFWLQFCELVINCNTLFLDCIDYILTVTFREEVNEQKIITSSNNVSLNFIGAVNGALTVDNVITL